MQRLTNWLVPQVTPLRPLVWALAFILACSTTTKIQLSENVLSRAAAMLAMTEDHQLQLGDWKSLTEDWARTPNGSYFSNKAPGPALIGVVLFYPLYKLGKGLINLITPQGMDKRELKNLLLAGILWLLSIVFQWGPALWCASRILICLKSENVGEGGLLFFLLGALFGNTGAFFLNSYFGHGFAMAATLAVCLFLLKGEFFGVGVFLGVSILGDYSCLFLVPAVLSLLLISERSRLLKRLWEVVKGASWPMGMMGAYHWICFGSPFSLPQKFQNPTMVWSTGKKALWGIITFIPSNYTLWELLVGGRKGILVTQPYILVLLFFLTCALLFWGIRGRLGEGKIEVAFTVFSLIFFGGVFCMNAGFNAWWGGGTPGPRYLSAAFVPLILSGSLLWNSWPSFVRLLLLIGLGVASVFSLLCLAVGDLPAMEPLWWYMVHRLTQTQEGLYLDIRLLVFLIIFLWGLIKVMRGARRDDDFQPMG